MSDLSLMLTIMQRERSEAFYEFYQRNGIAVQLAAFGRGTARSEVLEFLGLAGSSRTVLMSFVTSSTWEKLQHGLWMEMGIGAPGNGVAVLCPISGVGGRNVVSFLTQNQELAANEESSLKDTKQELIIAVTNLGYSEMVMQAAREAGAQGGTIIHAKGTGMQQAEKFLGISLAAEKELLLIVTKTENRNQLMQAVMERAGLRTKAGSVLFSLPVTDSAGLFHPNTHLAAAGEMK